MLPFLRTCKNSLNCRILTQIRTSKSRSKGPTVLIPKEEAKRFVQDCLIAVGTSEENACSMAQVTVTADEFGVYSHGLNRLSFYVNDVRKCLVDGKATPSIEKETAATAWVNGNYALGAVVGYFCMNLAIKKAKEVGVGWVAAYRSAHYGVAACYTIPMTEEGLIGFSCTNTSPMMVPFGAKKAVLGTNPLSVAAPGKDCDRLAFDMATTVVAKGKIQLAAIEGRKIPEGWVQDKDGKPITDPKTALTSGELLPLGGIHEGSKGTGLGITVEVFSGILAGANYGPKIPKWGQTDKKSNLGQCFVAVNPACFAPDFEERMSDLLNIIRNLEPIKPDWKMMVPGDPERLNAKKVAECGGIEYIQKEKENFDRLAEELCVKPMKAKC